MKAEIVGYANLEKACPACGADSSVFEINCGQFQPTIGKCRDCFNVWPVIRGTHAWKNFWAHKKEVKNGEIIV